MSMQVTLIDHMGTDLSVVNAARVSFGKEKDTLDLADEKLIGYLARHAHWSPFAHTAVSFRITAPIFVARQLAKHQIGAAWNEESRRYVDDEPTFYLPTVWRERADNVKQGSGEALHLADNMVADMSYQAVIGTALKMYKSLLKRGVAPEMARMVLPQSTMTSWIWTGSLLFFARVCKLRLEAHAQVETREVAWLIADWCSTLFPVSWAALMREDQQ
jgi:thymidylate synthase (FAD)